MRKRVKKVVVFIVGCVIVAVMGGVCLCLEMEYCASCSFCCARASMNAADDEFWHIEGYVQKFVKDELTQLVVAGFSELVGYDSNSVRRAFESCSADVKRTKEGVPLITIRIWACDKVLARNVAGICMQGFSKMIDERNSRVFDRHTARAKVKIETARRSGSPVPDEALREIEAVRAVLEKENYKVFGVNAVEVVFCSWKWQWFD